jgi:hypothetical protein
MINKYLIFRRFRKVSKKDEPNTSRMLVPEYLVIKKFIMISQKIRKRIL